MNNKSLTLVYYISTKLPITKWNVYLRTDSASLAATLNTWNSMHLNTFTVNLISACWASIATVQSLETLQQWTWVVNEGCNVWAGEIGRLIKFPAHEWKKSTKMMSWKGSRHAKHVGDIYVSRESS